MPHEANPFGKVVVPDHVVSRVRQRLGWTGGWREIRVEVRLDIIAGRVTDTRPNWTHSEGWTCPPRERVMFAYDAAASRCWVLLIAKSRIVVKTLLLSDEQRREQATDQMLRTGMQRR